MKARAILITLSLVLPALGPLIQEAWAVETELVLMTPISRASVDPVAALFRSQVKQSLNVDVSVKYETGGSPALLAKALEWGGKPLADVFWGGEYQYYDLLTKRGLLEPYVSANFNQVPETFQGFRLKDSRGHWMAVSFFSPGIQTNKDALKRINAEEPKTWDDLLKPIYRGQIVMTRPATSGGLHVDVELLLQSRGEDRGWAYWRRLAGNVGAIVSRSLEVSSNVEKGEYAIGIAIAETSAILAIEKNLPVGFVYPDPSALVPSPIGILKGAPHPELAKLFMDFVMSKDAQVSFLGGGLVPARQDIRFSDFPRISKAGILKQVLQAESIYQVRATIFPLNFTLSEQRFTQVNNFFDDTISKKLEELKNAWNALSDAQKAIQSAQSKIPDLKSQGFDTSRVETAISTAQTTLTSANANFDKGEYSTALASAQQARSQAEASAGLAEKIPFYVQYAWLIAVAVVGIIVAGSAFMFMRRRT